MLSVSLLFFSVLSPVLYWGLLKGANETKGQVARPWGKGQRPEGNDGRPGRFLLGVGLTQIFFVTLSLGHWWNLILSSCSVSNPHSAPQSQGHPRSG